MQRSVMKTLQRHRHSYHAVPRQFLHFGFDGAANALRPMKAKLAIIYLTSHIVRTKEIIAEPLLA